MRSPLSSALFASLFAVLALHTVGCAGPTEDEPVEAAEALADAEETAPAAVGGLAAFSAGVGPTTNCWHKNVGGHWVTECKTCSTNDKGQTVCDIKIYDPWKPG